MSNYIFTITAGRTGTAWLAQFIKDNLHIPSIHESLEIDDFGVRMPDIKTMRNFNDRGLNDFVVSFWMRKFDSLKGFESYAETNHTFAKCGLLEFAADYQQDSNFTFLCIRRNHFKQCLSYLYRGDFSNITLDWQWYLSPKYKKIIVNSTPFIEIGKAGPIIWYIYEMEARQEYYKILYSSRFKFIDLTLEAMTKPDGAKALLVELGSKDEPLLGDVSNQNEVPASHDLERRVEDLFRRVEDLFHGFNPKQAASEFISQGNRLG